MNDKLATIQKIKNIRKHPDADTLSIGNILGWQIIFNHIKDNYQENDLVIYICIDTIVPDHPEFEFLRKNHFRIKPIKLRHQESAGIVFPLSLLIAFGYNLPVVEGLDVTDIIKVTKYERPMSEELKGIALGHIPGFLIITDEDNLRTYPDAISELYSRPYYISIKVDGSSGAFFVKDNEFGVCSRRIHLKESETNGFWKIAKKYNIETSIKTEFPDMNISINGEVYGPGIQGNPTGATELSIGIFNLFNIDKRYYLTYDEITNFCVKYNIPMVKVIEFGTSFGYTLEELIQLANKQKYSNDKFAEGIVIRSKEPFVSKILNKSWSGKIISESYKEIESKI